MKDRKTGRAYGGPKRDIQNEEDETMKIAIHDSMKRKNKEDE